MKKVPNILVTARVASVGHKSLRLNHEVMMQAVIGALRKAVPKAFETHLEAVNCHHNYVQKETHFGHDVFVTRKGALSAKAGELGIIPGSLGAKSFIVRGRGNPESFNSCSHGAGRFMSRSQAKKLFTVQDQIDVTAGLVCRKDVDAVILAQSDLVEVVYTLKQVVCVKG